MLVQTRSDAAGGPGGPLVKIRVSRGSCQHEVSIPSQTTFGELKKVLAPETGLEPQEQRLLFRGKEKDDDERLHMAGIKDMSKVVLLEDPASKERKLQQMKWDQGMLRACEAVALVRAEVDKLVVKVGGYPVILEICRLLFVF
ncbi:hypothetical protein GW17_00030139 [Ensete ventricosum]|nr:hypothetical protein GW17_00030139 [Ensete ventricosum]